MDIKREQGFLTSFGEVVSLVEDTDFPLACVLGQTDIGGEGDSR